MQVWLFVIRFFGFVVLSGILVAIMRYITLKYAILDVPNERSSHSRPVPRGGGIAIVLISLFCWFASAVYRGEGGEPLVWGYGMAAFFIACVSWLDDVRHLSNKIRFSVHFLGALTISFTCGLWDSIQFPGLNPLSLSWLIGVPLTLLWIVGLTNAYNFMDGIDGIAGGQALVAGSGWMIVGYLLGDPRIAILGMAVTASSLGFLFHNWPPAKIFMGDVGSAFLGFSFAFLTVLTSRKDPWIAELSVFFVWPFLFDSIFTFFRRLRNRENVFDAHRSHLYQRLVQTGMSHGQVSGLYAGLACLGLLPIVCKSIGWEVLPWVLVAVIGGSGLGVWIFTVRREAAQRDSLE